MKILISIITTISDYKIKIKNDETLIKILIKILSKIFNENHIIFNDFLDEIKINQNSVFSLINMIIAEIFYFILNVIF